MVQCGGGRDRALIISGHFVNFLTLVRMGSQKQQVLRLHDFPVSYKIRFFVVVVVVAKHHTTSYNL